MKDRLLTRPDEPKISLLRKVLEDCDIRVRYATDSGLELPQNAAEDLEARRIKILFLEREADWLLDAPADETIPLGKGYPSFIKSSTGFAARTASA